MSSGLSCPIGFKNGTDGGLTVAFNALESMASPHSFLGINPHGQVSITRTSGNQYGHVVLRGGGGKPNYDSVNVALCEQALAKDGLSGNIMVDCSHANSSKDPSIQPLVMDNIAQQINEGNDSIVGLMIESNINWGNQSIPQNLAELQYGVSVTDACIDWDTTEASMRQLASKLQPTLPKRTRLL
jgi:3-deoxy-7-phosphoheptulonate synthase